MPDNLTYKATIKPLTSEETDQFLTYLNDHISDNGKNGTPLFLPISRSDLKLPASIADSFRQGQSISIDQPGWRRVFIALNEKEEIIGHADLKSHNQSYTGHRAVLGMGVDRNYRQMGLGRLLIETVENWARQTSTIDQIDLWVLSENGPAIRLYKKAGFRECGEVEDMFRIDGASHNYKMMAKRIDKA